MMRDTLLALGLLLSMASQLRLAGTAIGPGEVCLMIWLVLMLGHEAGRLGPPLTPALSRLLMFWVLFAVALSLGKLAGLAIDDNPDPGSVLHDTIAYLLLAAVSCLSVVEPGAEARLRRVAWLVSAFGTGFLALQLANAWGLFGISVIEPWFWDRLRGWSENPNQLALLCAALGLISLHIAETAARLPEKIAAIVCIILPIYVGRLTKSDTFSLVLLGAGPIFVALKLRSWLLSVERGITLRFASAWIVVLTLPLVFASAVPFGPLIAAQTEGLTTELSKNQGKETEQEAELRFHLWSSAISRGMESGMLGLGPGPHLEPPPISGVARANQRLIALNLQPRNFEAHNTLLDLFTQGGLIAVLSFVWLIATTLFMTYRARLVGLATLLCGLSLFTTAHLIVRLPIFWFAISLCLVVGTGTGRAAPVRYGS